MRCGYFQQFEIWTDPVINIQYLSEKTLLCQKNPFQQPTIGSMRKKYTRCQLSTHAASLVCGLEFLKPI